ncbi:MAG: DUF6456 domain-containing protein [Pseudomonadota bacterium]
MNQKTTAPGKAKKQWLRLAKLLSSRTRKGLPVAVLEDKIAIRHNVRTHHFPLNLVRHMIEKGEIRQESNNLKLTDQGLFQLRTGLGLSAEVINPNANSQVAGNTPTKGVSFNTSESPLMRLYYRKQKDGSSYISDNEFRAGERLRAYFERGQLQPKISASLSESVGRTKAGSHLTSDISDFALDARKRLDIAIDFLGPELAGVAIDICCFLKGYELVERERQWPPRSAKLMLRTALSLLAKHYGFESPKTSAMSSMRSWGSDDYRPVIS